MAHMTFLRLVSKEKILRRQIFSRGSDFHNVNPLAGCKERLIPPEHSCTPTQLASSRQTCLAAANVFLWHRGKNFSMGFPHYGGKSPLKSRKKHFQQTKALSLSGLFAFSRLLIPASICLQARTHNLLLFKHSAASIFFINGHLAFWDGPNVVASRFCRAILNLLLLGKVRGRCDRSFGQLAKLETWPKFQ